MHDARAVRLRQPAPDLRGDVDGLVHRQRLPLDPLLQRLPLVARHHEVELAVGGLVDLVDGADIGVVEGGCRLGFLQEPLLGRLVPGQIGCQDLDRQGAEGRAEGRSRLRTRAHAFCSAL